jgi:ferric iron reductase protein FhuF
MINDIFALSNVVRYVAIYRDGHLETKSKEDTIDASSSYSDRYEELLVNPTLITLATQRGNIDCGGLDYLIIRYGNFYQFVLPATWGHISVCIDLNADPVTLGAKVVSLLKDEISGA